MVTEDDLRCDWAGTDPRMRAYHDQEWGVPLHDDRRLFEFLILEGAQAGLSWQTILNKREAYRRAFAQFDPARVARFDRRHIETLLANPAIVRNRLKVENSVSNARALLAVQKEFGNFDRFVWSFVDHAPKSNRWRRQRDVPTTTAESDAMSKALKERGFRFVWIDDLLRLYAGTGMVNDHLVDCYRHHAVTGGYTA